MSVDHKIIVTCDQNPLPLKCDQKLILNTGWATLSADSERRVIDQAVLENDWGIVDVHGKLAHYCPHHRPVR